jgi:Glucodextranase, domain B/PASTA domain
MRLPPVLVFACLAAFAAGCGGDGEPRAQKPPTAVELDVDSPEDMATVRSATVDVRGTVSPAGSVVRVLGRAASVTAGGTFTATVPLQPGENVIDVMATARGRGPALTAFRVTREVPVEVPDLGGMKVEEVQDRLGAAGLGVQVEHGGGLLEELLPGDAAVCEQDPEAGAKVRRGTTVHVVVAKSC